MKKARDQGKSSGLFFNGEIMSINLDEMKKKLTEDLQQELDQEAKESGRLPEPAADQTGTDQSEPNPVEYIKSKSEDTKHSVNPDINIEDILKNAPEDEKGRKIVSDEIFDKYYKILPNGTKNESGTKQARNGGILKPFGADPEAEKDIQRKGGEALQAQLKQRRTLSEDIQIALMKKANPETIAALGLSQDANNQQAVIAAAILQAIAGNVKAQQFIRDTIGEQPTAKQDISVQLTDDDKALLDKVQKRLGIDQE